MIRLSSLVIGLLISALSLAQGLTLVDLNLRYDNPADVENAWSNRKNTTLPWLKNQQADLYFFQEVLHHQYIELQEQLAGYQSYGVGREDGLEKGEYSPIFFKSERFEMIESLTIWLSPTINTPSKGWDAACERIATVVVLKDKKDDQPLLCINTHWDHVGKVAQDNSADLISSLLHSLHSRYQIVGGDFNVTASHPGIQKLSEQLNLMQAQNSRDTYHGFRDEIITENGPIDLVFASDALQATKCQYYRHSTDGKFLSDHDALLIEWSKIKTD
jgi:hypothetical protein